MIIKVYQLLFSIGIAINFICGLYVVNPTLNNGWIISNDVAKVLFIMTYPFLFMLSLMYILNKKDIK